MKKFVLLPLLLLMFIGCEITETEVVPLPPGNLVATVVSSNQVDLVWKDNSTNETGFKIERKTDGGSFTEIGTTSKDITTFSDQTVNLNTTYTYRVYSTNSVGKSLSYSNEASVRTATVPSLSTSAVTELTTSGAKSGGTVTSDGGAPVTARGVVWSTETAPTISLATKTSDGTGTGVFQSTLTTLIANTKYYLRAYATNSAGTSYGEELSFTTTAAATLPSITTVTVTEITATAAKSGGSITADGNSPITARGVVWGTATNPTISLSTKTSNGTGSGAFQSAITGLAANTKYYVRAYATNTTGTGYGNEFSFTTTVDATLPSITTVTVTEITANSAKSGGSITADGNSPITARGVVWATTTGPTIALATKTSNGSGSGAFQSAITGLAANTKYYVRAYATNSTGTGYGNEFSFTTTAQAIVPVVSTSGIGEITAYAAKSGGLVSTGQPAGVAVNVRGVVWSTSTNPTVALSTKTTDGAGVGLFQSTLTGLTPKTRYYLRAYATSTTGIIGTGYGAEVTFKTDSLPVVQTNDPVIEISATGARSGGAVISDGGSPVTARGIVWSTDLNNISVSLSTKTTNGAGLGSFVGVMTGLAPNTKYYVKAYATNSDGTAYGPSRLFTTLPANSVVGANSKIWMDRNLGATRVAISSTDAAGYGDLYQWGREEDGHQKRTSSTTATLSSTDKPTTGNFITVVSGFEDWRNPQNANLWQGVTGINNPCPDGFRLPTIAEWSSEIDSWTSKDDIGAYASSLKLPKAGNRGFNPATVGLEGFAGYYWTSTVDGTKSRVVVINSSQAVTGSQVRAYGNSVRCIRN
jgi:uncharacterized protein (TIGR02145 family)